MKKTILILLITFLILAAAISYGVFYRSTSDNGGPGGKITVAATVHPVFDIARNIAGEAAEVKRVLPAGASPHTFELTPRDLLSLQDVRVFFRIGHGLDDWATDLTKNVPEAELVTVDEGIQLKSGGHDHEREDEHDEEHEDEHEDEDEHENKKDEDEHAGEFDPHYWLHFGNAAIIAENITQELVRIDPDNSEQYRQNLKEYQSRLAEKEAELLARLEPFSGESIVTVHESWAYFAENFHLNIAGSIEANPGVPASPQELALLSRHTQESDVKVVFTEPQLSRTVPEAFAQDNNLAVAVLDPIGGVSGRETYLDLMEFNIGNIFEAFAEF